MITVQKQKFDLNVTVSFDKNGGDSVSYQSKEYAIGGKYGDLPTATRSGYDHIGWYTSASGGIKVTKDTPADGNVKTLYARWEEAVNFTSFEVTTTSSYTKFGVYSATLKSGATSVTINWGDGSVEELTSISQKVHTYAAAGTYTVKINDRISALQISTNDSTWYTTTSQVRYTLKKILTYSTSITSIPSYGYYYCYSMTSVAGIGDSNITSLPTYCFNYCYNLSSLSGLSKITSIGTYCFYYCYYLSSFTGLGNITSLPNYSFQGCYCITSLATLPSTVTSYGQYCLAGTRISDLSKVRSTDTLNSYCFSGMNSLTSVATLTPRSSLPTYCFYNCTGMQNVNFSSWTSLTAIPNYCFQKNTALTSVTFNTQLKNIGSYAFYYCYASNMKSVSLKDTQLTSIGTYAFQYCYNLTSMSLPSTLTYLYDYSLAGCYNLKEISCQASNPPTTYTNTFGNSDSNGNTAYVGRNVKTAGNNKLYVSNPDAYRTSYWSSVLLDSSKCNYKFRTFDQYDIRGCDINGLSARYEYTGSEIVPSITVLNQAGTALVENTSYTKALADNIECGTASLSVTGAGSYHGTQVKTFKIYDPTAQSYEIDLNGQWRTPPQAWTNSDTRFNVYESNSNYNVNNGYAKMYVNVVGYTALDIYINSYAESNYDYTIAFQADKDVTSNPTKDTTGALTSTYGYQYNPSSYAIDSGTGWKKVSYSLDGGEHRIMICYRKDGSVNNGFDRGYMAIAVPAPAGKTAISSCQMSFSNNGAEYSGQTIQTVPVVSKGSTTYLSGTDYTTTSPADMTNACAKTITFTAAGSKLSGTATATFTIAQKNLSSVNVYGLSSEYEYTGSEIKPDISVAFDSIDMYITDGLVMMYDGIWNTGVGTHDSSATTWKDLVGNNNATVKSAGSFNLSSLVCSGSGLAAQGISSLTSDVGTIEVVAKIPSSVTNNIIVFSSGKDSSKYYACGLLNSNRGLLAYQYQHSMSYDGNNHLIHWNSNEIAYMDNSQLTKTTGNSWTASTSRSYLPCFGAFGDGTNPYSGNIYCVRVYNRVLTDDERRQNYEMDKYRFGIA